MFKQKTLLKILPFLFITIFLTTGIFEVFAVVNEGYVNPFGNSQIASPVTGVTQIWYILLSIVRWIYIIFFVVAVLFILLAAYNFLQGGANEKKAAEAKAQLKYAVIAIVVALISTGVSLLITQFLQSRGAN